MANGIPLRPGLIPSYAQRLGLLAQPGVTVGDITGRAIQPGLPARAGAVATSMGQPVMRGSQPPTLMRRPAPLPPMPLAAGAMRQAQRSPMAPSAPTAQPGFLERIAGIDPTSAAGQALGAAAATGLQMSGYRQVPITTAEGLGAMMAAGQKAFTSAREREQKAEIARQQRETDLRLKLMELQAAGAKTEREASSKVTEREMTLAKQFRDSSKSFVEAKLNYGRIVANATTPNPTGASDIALVFNFMKMLDPTSVVRESEYRAAENASPLLLQLGQQYNKLFRKEAEKLPESTRKMFLQAATETYLPYVEAQKSLEEGFSQEATQFGLSPKNVVVSKMPKQGTKDLPYIIYDKSEADNYPEGTFVMLSGELLEVTK